MREEIKEKNELLETVARRVNQLVSKFTKEDSSEVQKPISKDEVNQEIERCFDQIGAKEWFEMCFFDDLKFFVKLYPKLEELYEERLGASDINSKNASEGKETMANKMTRMGFPQDVEITLRKYIKIRNKFQHTMKDVTLSNFELAREAFAKVFVHLMLSSIESRFLFKSGNLKNREMTFATLTDIFSKRLTGHRAFRNKLVERLETVFNA